MKVIFEIEYSDEVLEDLKRENSLKTDEDVISFLNDAFLQNELVQEGVREGDITFKIRLGGEQNDE